MSKLNSRKIMVFIINTIIFTGFALLVLFYAKDIFSQVISGLVWAQIVNSGIVIGGNSFDKLTISQNFKPELYDK